MKILAFAQGWVATWPLFVRTVIESYIIFIAIVSQIFLIKAWHGRYTMIESKKAVKLQKMRLLSYMLVQVIWTAILVLAVWMFAGAGGKDDETAARAIAYLVSLWPMVAFADEKIYLLRMRF